MAKALAKGSRITGAQRTTLASQYAKRYAAGESIRKIAEDAGRSFGFVHGVLKEAGVELRGRGGATRGVKKAASSERSKEDHAKKLLRRRHRQEGGQGCSEEAGAPRRRLRRRPPPRRPRHPRLRPRSRRPRRRPRRRPPPRQPRHPRLRPRSPRPRRPPRRRPPAKKAPAKRLRQKSLTRDFHPKARTRRCGRAFVLRLCSRAEDVLAGLVCEVRNSLGAPSVPSPGGKPCRCTC